jgi:hypothetical protein
MILEEENDHYWRGVRWRETQYNVSMEPIEPDLTLKQLEQETRSTRESLRRLDKLPPVLQKLTVEDREMLRSMGIKW